MSKKDRTIFDLNWYAFYQSLIRNRFLIFKFSIIISDGLEENLHDEEWRLS